MNRELLNAIEKYRKNGKKDEEFECLKLLYEEDKDTALPYLRDFRDYLRSTVSESPAENMELLKQAYTLSAKDVFEDYMIAMEWDRENKFYLPRRKGLHKVVESLQDLEDDKLDLLCISMPPGVGKSGVALFYITWLAGKYPELGTLTSSHNVAFLQGAYEECLREISSPEYRWGDIFPGHAIVKTNAKDLQIAVDKAQKFPTLQFGSAGSGLAGRVRAVKLLFCDDLIANIDEALSIDRLDSKWRIYGNDLKQRKQGRCKELHIATRWSVHDIIGRLEVQNEGNPRARFVVMPALNEKGESNFDYGGDNGFTTEFYEDIRASMDEASFRALYMNEPIEREGLLYSAEDLRRYYRLPEGEPDAILAVCDTAEGGGDDTVLPVFAVYGEDHYLIDCVVSNALPEVSDELCADVLFKTKAQKCQFESNSAGGRTADKVNEILMKKGGFTHITKKRTTANKETKIIVESDWVKKHCLFLDSSVLTKGSMYSRFIEKLCSYTQLGKNKHDDVPDAVAQYSQFYRNTLGMTVKVVDRRSLGI